MTFEEFFSKKKINLIRLKEEDASLFEKLQNEYELMGEKSFDHSKKFLLNKWRRKYSLAT